MKYWLWESFGFVERAFFHRSLDSNGKRRQV